jgi:hypothetical protein
VRREPDEQISNAKKRSVHLVWAAPFLCAACVQCRADSELCKRYIVILDVRVESPAL